ncbi:MAG: protein translocase subunit SecD, partial [Armatimonadetes bacterium]|nr:protein translocase subunit SecD [Armatimonadota bacterium]
QADPAEAPAGEEATEEALEEKQTDADEAQKLADEGLRTRVEDRLNAIVQAMAREYGERIGDVHAEVVGSNITIIRTYVKSGGDAEQQVKAHGNLLLAALKKYFPAVRQIGEAERLEIDTARAMSDVKQIIGERIDRLGVAEANVREQGLDRVVVELPGVKDPDEAVAILGTTARMEFRKVDEEFEVRTEEGVDGRNKVSFVLKATNKPVPDELVYYKAPEFSGDKNIMVGSQLAPNSVQVTYDQEGQPAISLALNKLASRRFDAFASENQGSQIAIYLDRRCIDARTVKETHYGGQVQLTGGFATVTEARNLKILLDAGALPVPVDVVEQRTVSATLGADSVRQSSRAAIWGLVLILIVMIGLYRVPGVLACAALIWYGMAVLAILVAVDATLTLPGILGFILSVGMAVDGNVISFERLKEELRENPNRPMLAIIRNTYDASFAAIFDGNVTTLISGVVLFVLGTGPIRGFAVTLSIGTMCSMLSALYLTRTLQNLVAVTPIGANRRLYRS